MKGFKKISNDIFSNPLVIIIIIILVLIIVLAIFRPTSPFLNLGLGVNAHIGNIKGSFDLEAFDNQVVRESTTTTATLVLFMSPNCGHCRAMKPEWDTFNKMYNGNVNIKTIDCSDSSNSQLAREHGVQGYPTIRYYPNGLSDKVSFIEYNGERNANSISDFLNNQ